MKTKQLKWLDTHVESQQDYERDLHLKIWEKDLIDNDLAFLRELWQNWED